MNNLANLTGIIEAKICICNWLLSPSNYMNFVYLTSLGTHTHAH